MSDWGPDDERKHPRYPKGSGDKSGEFREKGDWADQLAAWINAGQEASPGDGFVQRDYDAMEINGAPIDLHARPRGGVIYHHGGDQMSDDAGMGVWMWIDDSVRDPVAAALRAGGPLNGMVTDSLTGGQMPLRQVVNNLDQALREGRLAHNTELWRGIMLSDEEADRLFPVGTTVRDRSFMSTSFRRSHAEDMIAYREAAIQYRPEQRQPGDENRRGYLLRILAPAGTSAAPGAGGLREVILDRDLETRVVSRDGNVLTLEVLT